MAAEKGKFEEESAVLKPVSEAADMHEAVGLWWGHAILNPAFDLGSESIAVQSHQLQARNMAPLNRPFLEERIESFVEALSQISRKQGDEYSSISVDYLPDDNLVEAAQATGIPADFPYLFPLKAITLIEGGEVTAKQGAGTEHKQIWPPLPDN